jgi:hypothetical protein
MKLFRELPSHSGSGSGGLVSRHHQSSIQLINRSSYQFVPEHYGRSHRHLGTHYAALRSRITLVGERCQTAGNEVRRHWFIRLVIAN